MELTNKSTFDDWSYTYWLNMHTANSPTILYGHWYKHTIVSIYKIKSLFAKLETTEIYNKNAVNLETKIAKEKA